MPSSIVLYRIVCIHSSTRSKMHADSQVLSRHIGLSTYPRGNDQHWPGSETASRRHAALRDSSLSQVQNPPRSEPLHKARACRQLHSCIWNWGDWLDSVDPAVRVLRRRCCGIAKLQGIERKRRKRGTRDAIRHWNAGTLERCIAQAGPRPRRCGDEFRTGTTRPKVIGVRPPLVSSLCRRRRGRGFSPTSLPNVTQSRPSTAPGAIKLTPHASPAPKLLLLLVPLGLHCTGLSGLSGQAPKFWDSLTAPPGQAPDDAQAVVFVHVSGTNSAHSPCFSRITHLPGERCLAA